MSETVGVTYTLLDLEHVADAGRLIALATVQLSIDGVAFELRALRVVRRSDSKLGCTVPAWRHPRGGKLVPAMVLPRELQTAISAEVRDVVRDGYRAAA